MSEEGTQDEEAGPELDPDPSQPPDPDSNPGPTSDRSGRGRVLLLLGAAAIATSLVLALAAYVRHRSSNPISSPRDGRAAISAPIGPHLPGNARDGVKLTGFVVDGAGIAVARAEVSAELERGV